MKGLIVRVLSVLAFAKAGVAWPSWPADTVAQSTVQPYDTFVKHFSPDQPATDVYLQDQFTHLYPNASIVVTQDRLFSPTAFVAAGADYAIKEIPNFHSIKRVSFFPPQRRRDGDGVLFESARLIGYEIAWKDYEFKAVLAQWQEGFNSYAQWHIIGETASAAKEFIHACASWNSRIKEAILVFDNGYWQPDHALWLSVQNAYWKDVILNQEFKDKVQHDYRSFFKSEKIYKDLEVPWKRGLIFLGPPGNGKTISLKAIMNEVKIPILYVKSFHTYQGDERGIRDVFTRARAEAPCVLVMEDLDSLITDQNRSFFLNEVDGIEDNDGLLLIGTTNHFDRLDPALSNRPSRFDRKYNFPDPSRDERRLYSVYWQKKLASNKKIDFPDSLLDEVADKTEKFSFAYLKEAFVSALLTLAGREDDHQSGLPFREVLLDQIKTLRKGLENGGGDFQPKRAGLQHRPLPSPMCRTSTSGVATAQHSPIRTNGKDGCIQLGFAAFRDAEGVKQIGSIEIGKPGGKFEGEVTEEMRRLMREARQKLEAEQRSTRYANVEQPQAEQVVMG